MNYKLEKILRLEEGVTQRKKIIATLTEYSYVLIYLLPIIGLLYFLFANENNIVHVVFISAFLFLGIGLIRCFYLIRKIEKERKTLSVKLYRLMKL